MAPPSNRVQSVLAELPTGLSALAQEAGISQALLSLIKSGHRSLTPKVAVQLAKTLDRWAARCTEAAEVIRSQGV